MLKSNTRRNAEEALREACIQYELLRSRVEALSIDLFKQKLRATLDVIRPVETFANSLANFPQEFARTIIECRMEVQRFHQTIRDSKLTAIHTKQFGAASGPAGVAAGADVAGFVPAVGVTAGVGAAAFAPTAAMALATTFGTASTGTAISALSGAAATSATLAWLGGGAIAAGGGGMAAGSALLAMAGPVVGGIAMVGSGAYIHASNAKKAEEATRDRIEVEAEIHALVAIKSKIKQRLQFLRGLISQCLNELAYFQQKGAGDYRNFTQEETLHLGILIDAMRSLGQQLNSHVFL